MDNQNDQSQAKRSKTQSFDVGEFLQSIEAVQTSSGTSLSMPRQDDFLGFPIYTEFLSLSRKQEFDPQKIQDFFDKFITNAPDSQTQIANLFLLQAAIYVATHPTKAEQENRVSQEINPREKKIITQVIKLFFAATAHAKKLRYIGSDEKTGHNILTSSIAEIADSEEDLQEIFSNDFELIEQALKEKSASEKTMMLAAAVAKKTKLLTAIFAIIQKIKTDPQKRFDFLEEILTTRDQRGSMPTNGAAESTNLEAIKIIFAEIEKFDQSFKEKKFALLERILKHQDDRGFSCLIDFAAKDDVEGINLFFRQINKFTAVAKPKPVELAGEMLLAKNDKGFNCVVESCARGHFKSTAAILTGIGTLQASHEQKLLLLDRVLTDQDSKGFAPLISACANNNLESVREIVSAIKYLNATEEKKFSLLSKTLCQQEDSGFTALISAASAENCDKIFDIIFAAIDSYQVPEEKKLALYKEVIGKQNHNHFGVLMNACKNQKLPTIRKIIQKISLINDFDLLKKVLLTKNNLGLNCLNGMATMREGSSEMFPGTLNLIKDFQHATKEQKFELLSEALLDSSNSGFTILINVCSNGTDFMRKSLFSTINSCCDDQEQKEVLVEKMLMQRAINKSGIEISAFSTASKGDLFEKIVQEIKSVCKENAGKILFRAIDSFGFDDKKKESLKNVVGKVCRSSKIEVKSSSGISRLQQQQSEDFGRKNS